MITVKDVHLLIYCYYYYFQLLPQTNMSEMYRYYESSTQLNQDGEVVIPTTDETARHALGYLLAGGFSGAVSRTCTAPFDRLKIYLITHSSTPERPLTFVNAVKSIYSYGGWKAFFVGNGLNILKIVPESAIKFYSYESCKQLFANILHCEDKDSIPTTARFAAGGMAGICAQFSIYPLETLKTRIMAHQVSNGNTSINKKSPIISITSSMSNPKLSVAFSTSAAARSNTSVITDTAKSMYARGGVRAFWPGLVTIHILQNWFLIIKYTHHRHLDSSVCFLIRQWILVYYT